MRNSSQTNIEVLERLKWKNRSSNKIGISIILFLVASLLYKFNVYPGRDFLLTIIGFSSPIWMGIWIWADWRETKINYPISQIEKNTPEPSLVNGSTESIESEIESYLTEIEKIEVQLEKAVRNMRRLETEKARTAVVKND